MSWIACDEKMPNKGGRYLVYFPSYSADGCKYMDLIGVASLWWDNNMADWFCDSYQGTAAVTHWMPLPPPPTPTTERRTAGEG